MKKALSSFWKGGAEERFGYRGSTTHQTTIILSTPS